VGVLEGQFQQLPVHAVEPHAVGDGGVDVLGLAGDAAALGGAHAVQGAHVVQPVRQLDDDDAHVARHGQQHLAEVLGLGVLLGLELDAVQLGHAIHQFGGDLAEAVGNLLLGDGGVLHHVVQQAGHQRLGVQVPVGEDFRHRQRMGDVGLAGDAELPGVGVGAEVVGGFDALDVLRLQVLGEAGAEGAEIRRLRRALGAGIAIGGGRIERQAGRNR